MAKIKTDQEFHGLRQGGIYRMTRSYKGNKLKVVRILGWDDHRRVIYERLDNSANSKPPGTIEGCGWWYFIKVFEEVDRG